MIKLFRTLAAVALLATTAVSAQAQTSFIGSDVAFGTPAGNIFWGSLGSVYTNVSNPFTINSTIGGLSANVSQAGASSFQRRDQGNGWGGNFGGGAQLLWTAGGNGPMSLLFNNAISAFGTQIQADFYGSFTAYISAYDAGNNLLGSFSANGNSNGAGNNSALFVGVSSTSGISRVELNVNTGNGDFAINDVRLDSTSTPEPASFVLFGTGLAALGFVRRRRNKA